MTFIKKMNPFDICVPCIKIENSDLLFEQYIMALNRYKYDTEVQNYNSIKRNRIFFFILRNKNSIVWMDYIYMKYVF